MKRILFLLPRFPELGGVEKITLNLAGQLARRGYWMGIYAGKGSSAEIDSLDFIADYPDVHFELSGGLPGGKSESDGPLPDGEFLREYVEEEGIDTLITQGFTSLLIPALREVRKIDGLRIVSVLHTNPRMSARRSRAENEGGVLARFVKGMAWGVYEQYSYRKYLRTLRTIANLSDKIIVLSEGYKDQMLRLLPYVKPEKIAAIPNFIPDGDSIGAFNLKNQNIIPDKGYVDTIDREKLIVYVGRVVEHTKRVSRVIELWRRVAPLFPDWRLEIVGDGPQREEYEQRVRREGMERISFSGIRRDIPALLRRASVLLQTSDYEGMPMIVIEAMREGCVPVVYNSYAAASELIADNEDGLLITPFDEDEYFSRLTNLLQSEKEIARLSNRAIESSKRYTPAAVLPSWENIL
ncbi:MAG: glycosyltransferase [Muribaculaceae bacterium]|nr:glycosyltransferase [Muribaculaceae bacterium]